MAESSAKKRVLLISSWFPADAGRRGLMNELADAVVASGSEIDVIALDWRDVDISSEISDVKNRPGLNVYRFQSINFRLFGKAVKLMVKWFASSLKAVVTTIRLLCTKKYDVIISGLPSAVWAPVLICLLFSRSKKYLIQWDFMPFHHYAIGVIPGGFAYSTLLMLERCLIRGFDVIGCMSEKNVEFLKANYWIGKNQRVEILPIWTEAVFPKKEIRNKIRAKYNLPEKAKIAVFGGTLSKGRGLDDILAAALIAKEKSPDILFLIVGRGPLESELRQKANDLSNVKIMPAIPRNEYLSLISTCDCGIVATLRDPGVPTFPSKTLDYFRAGIPVVASVEDSTDFGVFLTKHDAGVVVKSGDPQQLAETIIEMFSDRKHMQKMHKNGRQLVENYFNVNIASKQVLNCSSLHESRQPNLNP